ncbi:MAG: signal peptidase II [Chloroflexota bacterium]
MRQLIKKYLLLFGIAGLIITLDQITKNIVRSNLTINEMWSPWEWLAPYARVVHWRNTGAAFGIFQSGGTIFAVLAVIVTGIIIFYYPQLPQEDKVARIALAMQLGGALGNLIDRLTIGYVTDFFSFGNFPVFNVADMCITCGTAVLLLGMWVSERKAHKKAKGERQDTLPVEDKKTIER